MTVSIRLATEFDAEGVTAVYAPFVADTAISFEMVPPSTDEMAERMRVTLATHPWLVAETEGAVVGYAYGAPFRTRAAYRWSAEVSVYIAQTFHRLGIGRRLYAALFELLSKQGYRRAYAGITLPNQASIFLHESMDFETVGAFHQAGYKFGAWHDVAWLQRGLATESATPAEIASVDSVCRDARWHDC